EAPQEPANGPRQAEPPVPNQAAVRVPSPVAVRQPPGPPNRPRTAAAPWPARPAAAVAGTTMRKHNNANTHLAKTPQRSQVKTPNTPKTVNGSFPPSSAADPTTTVPGTTPCRACVPAPYRPGISHRPAESRPPARPPTTRHTAPPTCRQHRTGSTADPHPSH